MTVAELEQRMSHREYGEWIAYDEVMRELAKLHRKH